MSVILFIVGVLVIGAGIAAIGLGIPINEFNLGNTLIVSGTIAFSTGLILIGLAAAVDQLAQVVKALRGRAPARPQPQAGEQPAMRASPAQAAVPLQAASPAPPSKAAMPPPPRNPIAARPREAAEATEAQTEAPASAIERLRSSLVRPDVRPDVRPGPKVPDPADAEELYLPTKNVPASATPPMGTNGAAPPSGAEAPKKKPPLDFLFRPKARDPQAEPFDAAWPKRGGRQAEEAGERAGGGGESARPPAEVGGDGGRSTGILKSGVVDGMAYTLYVDGSIEAQLPQGTVRFGSIAELRAHIENNS